VGIAGVAGIVRSYSKAGHSISELPRAFGGDSDSQGEAREEIRKNYELTPGAKVEVAGINGAVKIETAEIKTADVYIERIAKSPEAFSRRKITIENSLRFAEKRAMPDSLRVYLVQVLPSGSP